MFFKCITCQQEKIRSLSGQRRKDGGKIHVDEAGRWWNGRQCPTCKNSPVNKAPRGEGRGLLAPDDFVIDPITSRKCRKCGIFLPSSRYRHCGRCEPQLEYYDIFADYSMTLPAPEGLHA